MRVLILHETVSAAARADELDLLDQAAAVRAALRELGHESQTLQLGSDLEADAKALRAARPDLVFNLVESLDGQGRLISQAPELLDRLGLAYTGSAAAATRAAASKLHAKRVLEGASLPTPHWLTLDRLRRGEAVPAGRYLCKSVWEHGSLGLDAVAVFTVDAAGAAERLRRELEARRPQLGGEAFAEAFVEGREFNLALLEGEDGPFCLPPAEIRFAGFGPDEPRIVGYRAKWAPGSSEDERTPRSFDFDPADDALLALLSALAVATWSAFGLGGYARVDFRVGADGAPQIVDVNTNPCLSPDAGYAAALARAGLSFTAGIERILQAAQTLKRA